MIPSIILIGFPLIALLAMSVVFRDNFGAKAIAWYFGTYLVGGLAIVLCKLPLPLLGVVGAVLVLIMFFHAKLRRFM